MMTDFSVERLGDSLVGPFCHRINVAVLLIYITKALSKGNYLYTDTAMLSYCYCLTMMSSTSFSNNVITFALYLLGVPGLFIHIAVIKLIISVESVY